MYPNIKSSLSLSKVLGGVSKSLNVIKNIIPIYEDAKPIYEKVTGKVKPLLSKESQKKTISLTNNPTFFK